MNETKLNQFKDRSHMEKPSRLSWLFPYSLLCINFLIAIILLLIRATGFFQGPQSFLPLLTVGGLLACISIGGLLLMSALRLMNMTVRQQNGFTLMAVLPVFAGTLALLPMGVLTLPGFVFLSVAYFLGYAIVLELINRECFKYRAIERVVSEQQLESIDSAHNELRQDAEQSLNVAQECGVFEEESGTETPVVCEENNEALFKALLGQTDSIQELDAREEDEEYRSQWMNRSKSPDGGELVEGGALVQFSRNQKVSIVHLGLFPPLEGKLSVACEFESDLPVRFRILEMRGYGISVEVKRTEELDLEFETYLYYQISGQQFKEGVA